MLQVPPWDPDFFSAGKILKQRGSAEAQPLTKPSTPQTKLPDTGMAG
jgi:hypothetical protein